ncbi:glycoside hydrolase family 3 N-terminal domain-containing protein [Staphylococcus agnetis]|uniref:glycoside hydrolase family 3 N-terminal domain-containing protein n=1 Tax=Staphylococcus agnetis TaxID=985762 RepID=UPI00208ED6A8|nr:glycoside hydrolase family 3 N-terminal domain-containing protein [Staphylococcus agnetis]
MTFDPCVDIVEIWRNTIVNTRSYGTNAETMIRYSNAYIDGYRQNDDMITCVKHFPGDGTE